VPNLDDIQAALGERFLPADHERLRMVGFTEDAISDISATAPLFAPSNLVGNVATFLPNPESITMGT
jgi:hypothetical protein